LGRVVNDITSLVLTLLMLLVTYTYVSTISPYYINKTLDFDLRRLSTIEVIKSEKEEFYLLHVQPFNGTERCKVLIYLSPFEFKTFKRNLNLLFRSLASSSIGVVQKGPRWPEPPALEGYGAAYCWGPSCPHPDGTNTTILMDNAEGSYQFLLNVTSPYGPLSVLFANYLLKVGTLHYAPLKKGIWVGDVMISPDSSLVPLYAYDPQRAFELLYALCEGGLK